MARTSSRWVVLPLLALFTQSYLANASPFPPNSDNSPLLESRDCDNPCGFYSQLCCTSSEVCTTDSNGQAACKAGSSDDAGEWEYFTTTYVQTDLLTVTSTGSRPVSAPTSTDSPNCKASLGQTECGDVCCSAAEACNSDGKCVRSGSSPFETMTRPSATPPSRPTSTSGATVTSSVSPTTTMAYIPAVGTDGSSIIGITTGSGGLSGGAIAGIVVGSLAGAFVLLLLCVCFCVGSCVDRTRALFFGGRRHRHSQYTGSAASQRPGRNWFGRTDHHHHEESERKSFFNFKWAGIGALIAAILLCFGLGKRNNDESEKSYTYYTGSSYYDDPSVTSSSSSSSNPRRPPQSHVYEERIYEERMHSRDRD